MLGSKTSPPQSSRRRWALLAPVLLGLCTLELLLTARYLPEIAPTLRALLLLLCGLGIGVGAAFAGRSPVRGPLLPVSRAAVAAAWLVLASLLSILILPSLQRALRGFPLDPRQSDIYPQVAINIRHLLSGVPVYAEHTELGLPIFPTWLPAQWLPFLATSAMEVDHRWLPPVAYGLATLLIGLSDIRNRSPGAGLFLVLLWSALVPATIMAHHQLVVGWTMEFLIAGYYLVLAWSLRESRPVFVGAGLGLCLVSRYALAPWVLLLGAVYWASRRRRQLVTVAGVALGIVLALYVLPFLARDPGILVRSFQSYTELLPIEWVKPERSSHLYAGYGLAGWLSDNTRGDLPTRLRFVRHLHLAVSVGIVFLLLPLASRQARRSNDPSLPALWSLKGALTVFYAFVPVPYPYLWVVPVAVSSQVLALVLLPPARPPARGTNGTPHHAASSRPRPQRT